MLDLLFEPSIFLLKMSVAILAQAESESPVRPYFVGQIKWNVDLVTMLVTFAFDFVLSGNVHIA